MRVKRGLSRFSRPLRLIAADMDEVSQGVVPSGMPEEVKEKESGIVGAIIFTFI